MKRFKFLEHTADVKFQAFGNNLEEVFENSALRIGIRLHNKGAYDIVNGYLSIGLEKDYMKAYISHGLTNEKTLDAKHELNHAVEKFEDETKAQQGTDPVSSEVKNVEIKIENIKWKKSNE